MRLKVSLATVMLAGLMCANLPAAPITGTFDIAGNVTLTAVSATLQTIDWFNLISNAPQLSNVGSVHTGDFTVLPTGASITIANLDSTTEHVPPPATFPPVTFITFPGFALPNLDITEVFPGIFTSAQCALPPAVGQTCTPNAPGSANPGPFNLSNQQGTTVPIQTTVSFAFGGITADGLSTWTGVFSANFNEPYQSVLATLAATGSVTNTYAGTIVVTAIPEAGTMSLLGLGLVGVSLKLRRRRG
jgi:PEP-CTERM motif